MKKILLLFIVVNLMVGIAGTAQALSNTFTIDYLNCNTNQFANIATPYPTMKVVAESGFSATSTQPETVHSKSNWAVILLLLNFFTGFLFPLILLVYRKNPIRTIYLKIIVLLNTVFVSLLFNYIYLVLKLENVYYSIIIAIIVYVLSYFMLKKRFASNKTDINSQANT